MYETQDLRETHLVLVVQPLWNAVGTQKRWDFFNAFFSFRFKESHYANCSLQAVLNLNARSYLNIYLYVQMFCRSEPWNVIFALLGNEISFTWRRGYITAFLLSPCSIPACFQPPLLLGSPMTPSQCRHLPAICGPLMRHLVTRHRIFHLLKSHHLIHHKECGKEEKNIYHLNNCEHFVLIFYCGREQEDRYRR